MSYVQNSRSGQTCTASFWTLAETLADNLTLMLRNVHACMYLIWQANTPIVWPDKIV